ncbi:unnamed protein product (macronuclear) [Paramecium tetraurelia]|uniref:Uncharacterized protein n=1 Tax=Paramecium tetraurelia TaxID=5888 RepID=A0BYT8_PARTE|nr:uncharacterized protein GSPATT00033558001 [Paramecium tetraurelia]CAK63705.1 unnamed protein product [Paramecium tetraurelia]|eukprot:XP_001431103.1 hypothetical protein (macronuclear) [Paramecium tetraurelia strain d4-2]
MNKQERENVKQRIEERIFQIKLKNTQHVLKQQLEKMPILQKQLNKNMQPNIWRAQELKLIKKIYQMILKNYPLNRCEITGGWNTSGLYADTINIVVRQKKKNIDIPQGQKDKDVLDEVQKEQDLKKITIKKE